MSESRPADDRAQDSIALNDPLIDAARTTGNETHLKCPNCGYLLVGLPEDRCPECGLAFDRARLLLEASSEGRRVHPWDDSPVWVRPFLATCYLTWFHPRRFASAFPRFHSGRSAWTFSFVCYGVALTAMLAVTVAPLLFIDAKPAIAMVPFVLVLLAGFAVAGMACESLSALVLSRCVRVSDVAPSQRYSFWRGIMHFFGSYFIVSSCGGALIASAVPAFLGWPIVGVTFLWWIGALGRAVHTRTPQQTAGHFAAFSMLFVIGVLAIALAAFLGLVAFTLWYEWL